MHPNYKTLYERRKIIHAMLRMARFEPINNKNNIWGSIGGVPGERTLIFICPIDKEVTSNERQCDTKHMQKFTQQLEKVLKNETI